MRTYKELITAVADKMFMTSEDLNTTEYNSKVPRLVNECLTIVANEFKPLVKQINLTYKGEYNPVVAPILVPMDGDYYKVTYNSVEPDANVGVVLYKGDRILWRNEDWQVHRQGYIVIDMPEDFLEFADFNPTVRNRYGKIIPGDFVYLQNAIQLSCIDDYTYQIQYHAVYPLITDAEADSGDSVDLVCLGIPISVLNVIPTYVASELMLEDDPQRSVMLRNQFEVMAQRLEQREIYKTEHIEVRGGWL